MTMKVRQALNSGISSLLAFSIVACSSTRVVTEDDPLTDTDHSITVYLHDDRMIKFDDGNYAFSDTTEPEYIQGIGREYQPSRSGFSVFKGRIQRSEIDRLEVSEPSDPLRSLEGFVEFTLIVIGFTGMLIGTFTGNTHEN